MIRCRRRDIIVLAAALAAFSPLVRTAEAQADEIRDEAGPVLRVHSSGWLHLRGAAWRRAGKNLDLGTSEPDRVTDIVVSQVRDESLPVNVDVVEASEAEWAEARTYFAYRRVATEKSVSQVETIELIRGYAYVKMEKVEIADPTEFSFSQVLERLIHDPDDPLLSVVVAQIARETGLNVEQLSHLRSSMEQGLADLAKDQLWRVVLELDRGVDIRRNDVQILQRWGAEERQGMMKLWEELSKMSPDELVGVLLEKVQIQGEDSLLHAFVTAGILDSQSGSTDLATLMSLLHYPFIISRRSSGGAEGTEIVIYARGLDPDDLYEYCEVFYFFLHSGGTAPIYLLTYIADPNAANKNRRMHATKTLGKCSYARVHLRRAKAGAANGSNEWHIVSLDSITKEPIDDGLDPHLKTVLRQAHSDAVRAGIKPAADLCGIVGLTDPPNENSNSDPDSHPANPPTGGSPNGI